MISVPYIYLQLQSVFKNLLSEGTLKPSDLKSMPLEELPVHEEDQVCLFLSLYM